MTTLLVACSSRKDRSFGLLPAWRRYTGSLFVFSLHLARLKGWKVKILSAKYGFIDPSTLIPYYNSKLTKQYEGPWPKGKGYWIGSMLYFGGAPARFKPLSSSKLPIGKLLSFMKEQIRRAQNDLHHSQV